MLVGMNGEPMNLDMSPPITQHLLTDYANIPESGFGLVSNSLECTYVIYLFVDIKVTN